VRITVFHRNPKVIAIIVTLPSIQTHQVFEFETVLKRTSSKQYLLSCQPIVLPICQRQNTPKVSNADNSHLLRNTMTQPRIDPKSAFAVYSRAPGEPPLNAIAFDALVPACRWWTHNGVVILVMKRVGRIWGAEENRSICLQTLAPGATAQSKRTLLCTPTISSTDNLKVSAGGRLSRYDAQLDPLMAARVSPNHWECIV
jgi:hypothetical protein